MTGQTVAHHRRRRTRHSRCAVPLRRARRVRGCGLFARPRCHRADSGAAARPRHGRSADAGGRRARHPARDPRRRRALSGRADDRLRLGRHRGRSGEARRDGLPDASRSTSAGSSSCSPASATRSNGGSSVLSIEGDLARRLEFCGMIGRAPRMQDLFGMIRRLAPHVRLALITGETGTGKELVARALHSLGPRRDRRFIAVNCSAVNDTAFESELFGHVRGGFLGATENKPGLFELADGGTLFLDEIGGLPPTAQAKLLRVLELGEVTPRRSARAAARRRPRPRRDQPRPARRGRGGTLPRRSLLPPQRRRGEAAAAARSARGHPVPDGGVRARDRRAAAEAAARADAGRRSVC